MALAALRRLPRATPTPLALLPKRLVSSSFSSSVIYDQKKPFDTQDYKKTSSHRSDAQQRIGEVPPIEVDGDFAVCEGGGGATGHPAEWIQLSMTDGPSPQTCKYCGLRFIQKTHHHGPIQWPDWGAPQ